MRTLSQKNNAMMRLERVYPLPHTHPLREQWHDEPDEDGSPDKAKSGYFYKPDGFVVEISFKVTAQECEILNKLRKVGQSDCYWPTYNFDRAAVVFDMLRERLMGENDIFDKEMYARWIAQNLTPEDQLKLLSEAIQLRLGVPNSP